MSTPIELDLDAIETLSRKATPGPWWIDSHGCMMVSQADGGHKPIFQAAELVKKAVRHPETGNLSHWPNDWDASFIATVNPLVVLELVRRLRASEELSTARIEQIPADSKVVTVFANLTPEHRELAEHFADAVKKRCTSGQWTLVTFFPTGSEIKVLSDEQLRQAGLMRIAGLRQKPAKKLKSTLNDGRPAAVVAREHGWGVGTCLVGDEGAGPTVIQITALGEGEMLAKTISRNGTLMKGYEAEECSWSLDCRDWQEVPS